MKKKSFICLLVVATLLVYSVVPVFAAEQGATQYVPIIPEFLSIGNGVNFKMPISNNDTGVNNFLKDFYDKPYLVVLKQETYSSFCPADRSLRSSEFVGEDKRWSIQFLKPKYTYRDFSFEFTYFNPLNYLNTSSHSIQVSLSNNNRFDILEYNYDFKNKKFYDAHIRNNIDAVNFSYVIDSSALSKPIASYPNYSCLGGKDFIVQSYDLGKPCHYDWWIGKKRIDTTDTTGIVKPLPKDISGGNYPKDTIGGDGDVSLGDTDGTKPCKFTTKFYCIDEKGNKVPFSYDTYGTSSDFTVPLYGRHTFTPHEFNGYVPEHKTYKWKASKYGDRQIEVVFHKKGTSSGGTSPGGTITGGTTTGGTTTGGTTTGGITTGGTTTGGITTGGTATGGIPTGGTITGGTTTGGITTGGTTTGGTTVGGTTTGGTTTGGITTGGITTGGTVTDDSPWVSSTDNKVPINKNNNVFNALKPFNPFDWNNFEPKTKDPWNVFDLFEGILKPKPLEFPNKVNVPQATEPTMNIPQATEPTMNIPQFTEPTMNIPQFTEPTMNIPLFTEPTMNIPIVEDPFKNWSTYSVNDPLSNINVPVVDDPFKNWGK